METLVINCQTLPEPLFSFIGAKRVTVSREAGRVVLTLETEIEDNEQYIDGPNGDYIDPADYPDTTAYLNALPGVAERIIAYDDLPDSEFKPAPMKFFNV